MKFKRLVSSLLVVTLGLGLFVGCGKGSKDWRDNEQIVYDDLYRTYYEIFLYSYCDSNGDGIGDINGLISKLDYLNDGDPSTTDDLGINGIWLMPIMSSPSYHKYDTTDYFTVDEAYGTNEDMEKLLEECHARGINVIIDLAMNHSSNEHPWFKEAYSYYQSLGVDEEPNKEDCKYMDWYNFTKTEQGGYTRVAGTDWFYESRFVSSMPDLNLENEEVIEEYKNIAKYWLDMGVDGFRLDAVKYFDYGNNTNCINTLSWFNDYVKSVKEDAYIVCECWDNQVAYAEYYTSGVDSMFDFAFGDGDGLITNTARGSKKASSYVERLIDAEQLYRSKADTAINAPFYTNHDMNRSVGYYAGEFAASKAKIALALNMLTTGNCFIYYGDEIGMNGSGKDENKRAPMYWGEEEGMCSGPKDMEKFDMRNPSLAEQKEDAYSYFNFTKDIILLRNQNPEIARGTTTNLEAITNDDIMAIQKTYNDSVITIVVNLGEEAADVDLSSVNSLKIVGEAKTIEGDITFENNVLNLPAYSVVVLRYNEE